jgi:hypothetical protein
MAHIDAILDAYRAFPDGDAAFIDETYDVDPSHDQRFYVCSAVIVKSTQRDPLREEIEEIAGESYWHTTEALRQNREKVMEMVSCLASPHGSERCAVSVVTGVTDSDSKGEAARERSLSALLRHLSAQVDIFVLERRQKNEERNRDARTKEQLVKAGELPKAARFVQTSPKDEHLLWLPDLVCSSFRQSHIGRTEELFRPLHPITEILRTS